MGLLARKSLSVGKFSMPPGTRISVSGAVGKSISGATSGTVSTAARGVSFFTAGAVSTTAALGAQDASARTRLHAGMSVEVKVTMESGSFAASDANRQPGATKRFARLRARPNRMRDNRETGLAGRSAVPYAAGR